MMASLPEMGPYYSGRRAESGCCCFQRGVTLSAKSCPNCRLHSPETAEVCDCGYDFRTKQAPPHSKRSGVPSPLFPPDLAGASRPRGPRFTARSVALAGAVAVISVLVSGVARWPSAQEVRKPSGNGREWMVTFSTGDAVMVPMELDTRTTEAVLTSQQVRLALKRIERRQMRGTGYSRRWGVFWLPASQPTAVGTAASGSWFDPHATLEMSLAEANCPCANMCENFRPMRPFGFR